MEDGKPDKVNGPVYGIFLKTGKGRLSPNKGKDVYIFQATEDEDDFIKGQFKIGFWEIEGNYHKVEIR